MFLKCSFISAATYLVLMLNITSFFTNSALGCSSEFEILTKERTSQLLLDILTKHMPGLGLWEEKSQLPPDDFFTYVEDRVIDAPSKAVEELSPISKNLVLTLRDFESTYEWPSSRRRLVREKIVIFLVRKRELFDAVGHIHREVASPEVIQLFKQSKDKPEVVSEVLRLLNHYTTCLRRDIIEDLRHNSPGEVDETRSSRSSFARSKLFGPDGIERIDVQPLRQEDYRVAGSGNTDQ